MMYLDLNSFAVGMVTGIAATAIFVGFGALLVANAGKDLDKRGLSARHSAREQWHGELARVPDLALPVLDPLTTPVEQLLAQADVLVPPYMGPSPLGSSTVAGRPPARPSRHKVDALAAKRLHRSQSEGPDAA